MRNQEKRPPRRGRAGPFLARHTRSGWSSKGAFITIHNPEQRGGTCLELGLFGGGKNELAQYLLCT
jgi:hypothetical protein